MVNLFSHSLNFIGLFSMCLFFVSFYMHMNMYAMYIDAIDI